MRNLVLAVVMWLAACAPKEGVRCNPALFEDECAAGLQCTVPANCVVAVCCASDGTSDDPGCRTCATDDLGTASMPD